MTGQVKHPPQVEAALNKSDALRNAIACRLQRDDDREGFREEIAVLADLADEADAELERVKREQGLDS